MNPLKESGKTGIIYCWTCLAEGPSYGLKYVGQTCCEERRKKQHLQYLNKKDPHSYFHKVLFKYNNLKYWKYEVLEDNIPCCSLNEREVYWITIQNSLAPLGMNLCTGGWSKMRGETVHKISESNKGKKMSPESRKKMSESAKKRRWSEETKKKIGASSKGRGLGKHKIISEETKKKMSESAKKRRWSEETKKKIRETMRNRYKK